MTWANGQKYVGEWKDGKYHGQGTYTWPDGKKYVGEWKDGKYHGPGTIDGRVIDAGIWKDNKLVSELSECEGSPATDMALSEKWTNCYGNYTFTDEDRVSVKYVGEWKDGKYHGQGTFTRFSGSGCGSYREQYVGEWKDGKRHGRGAYTNFFGGYQYFGEWKDGKEHGQGSSILGWQNDGCDGEFRDGDYIPGSGVCWH
tara:strand:- start:63 stop:659 length:597 start_codon:yes stop_codon:yes gene_type:complete